MVSMFSPKHNDVALFMRQFINIFLATRSQSWIQPFEVASATTFGCSFPPHWTRRRLPRMLVTLHSCCATSSVSAMCTRLPRPKTTAFAWDQLTGEAGAASAVARATA